MRQDLIQALQKNQGNFGLSLPAAAISRLADHYELIQEQNAVLHLVGPGTTEDFAVRHILESLTLLEYLPENSKFADVGAGAGLPGIPCLLAREDLRGVLIESKEKKARFLTEAIEKLGLENRVEVIARQFEEIERPDVSFVTCRALDKFALKLPKLIKWSEAGSLLLFGGENLRHELQKQKLEFSEELLPLSEKRFLFYGKR